MLISTTETRDLALITRANEAIINGQLLEALADLDQALSYIVTPHARWNRSQVLMSLGDYRNAAPELEARWELFSELLDVEGKTAAICAPLWRGENIGDKRLLLYHECGYGDSIMLLRYIPLLRDMGAEVTLLMPTPLRRLIEQFDVPMISQIRTTFDYRCPMFSLLAALQATPETVPDAPYLCVDPAWRQLIYDDGCKKLGICWSSRNDFSPERNIGLERLIDALPDCQFYSLQNHDHEWAECFGVICSKFKDFAEVAGLIDQMDAIVSIDTAALNLAGAIGHPNVNALLPFAPVWRWWNPRWYPSIHQCRQKRRGDWGSALEQMKL
jgi:hypothetical protein